MMPHAPGEGSRDIASRHMLHNVTTDPLLTVKLRLPAFITVRFCYTLDKQSRNLIKIKKFRWPVFGSLEFNLEPPVNHL